MITTPDLNILQPSPPAKPTSRPDWLRVRMPSGEGYAKLKALIDSYRLHTVCEEARCPNIAECWGAGTATIMILGETCTRSCGFCAVKTGRPTELDLAEPKRVAEAVRLMNLRHTVITSVNRDELDDGGASIWAETIREIRKAHPATHIEVLIPDFQGDTAAWDTVMRERPEILNHNIETVPRLYRLVRPQAKYQRSLDLLKYAKETYQLVTKSGLMVGIGEQPEEVLAVMQDLRTHKVDILTIGQYLQPTKAHLPVHRFVPLEEFEMYKRVGLEMGFRHVESGPLVRSSYHAAEQAESSA
ncbi:MAG: lipoyl synthase [Chloroherpetonaceae bacterium]|nr:lipoyl synthase [Chloroherpetonaceae bacterium]MCS7212564.1 lipoyl synthase [Chloroherpetonaceae bacterium]MDW8018886.1 lipoyl synthase [Chloroherpetonaceae bacterium]MDW8466667.1 lipoyl synthase [Chloroherpetonaceae bacterium]